MVLVQKWPFFQTFFFRQYRQGKCFLRYSRTKNAFLGYKNKKFKKSKNWHFSLGLTHGFGPKMAIFPTSFFLGSIGQENLFYDILEGKNAFLGYKNKKSKKSKNWHFSKGVNPWFWSKNGHFSNFFFRKYRQWNCLLQYSRANKRLFGFWKQTVQKVEKWPFFQRG